jgi:hypothetical protein
VVAGVLVAVVSEAGEEVVVEMGSFPKVEWDDMLPSWRKVT